MHYDGNTNLLSYGYIGLIFIMPEIINFIETVDGIVSDFNDQFEQTIVFCIDKAVTLFDIYFTFSPLYSI